MKQIKTKLTPLLRKLSENVNVILNSVNSGGKGQVLTFDSYFTGKKSSGDGILPSSEFICVYMQTWK